MKVGIISNFGMFDLEFQRYKHLYRFGVTPIPITDRNLQYKNTIRINSIGASFSTRIIFDLTRATKHLDLIHAEETYFLTTKQALDTGKPVIVTVWENVPLGGEKTSWEFLNKIRHNIKKETYEKSKILLATSKSAKNALEIDGADLSKVIVLYPAVDTKMFSPKEGPFVFQKNKIKILFAARLVEEKGILDLLYALTNLNNVLLIIAGVGPLENKIRYLIKRLNLQDKVIFLGKVPYQKMPDLYNSCDIVCVPSVPNINWQEQFGYVFAEAMSCKKPVVSTSSGAIPEVVENGKTGILVPPGDLVALQNALEELIHSEKKRKRYGENGRKRAIEKYDSLVTARRLSQIYRKVI